MIAGVLALAQLLVAPDAIAQTYPSRPIRLIVPTSVSTPVDILSRIVAEKMSAVTGPQRIAALSDVPTMIEAGYPDFVVRDWQGFVAKAGTPREIVAKDNAAIAAALATGEVRRMFAKLGADPAAGSPETFAKLIGAEVERWGKVAKAANIKMQ